MLLANVIMPLVTHYIAAISTSVLTIVKRWPKGGSRVLLSQIIMRADRIPPNFDKTSELHIYGYFPLLNV